MSATLEVLTFFGGCLFYAIRGQIGKWLLSLLVWLGKRMFKMTATEIELYALHKNETLEAKRSGTARAQKSDA